MYVKRECNFSFASHDMVTLPLILMTGMWAMLDQCFLLSYLSSNTGHSPIVSSLRVEGILSSRNDLSLAQLPNSSDPREQGNISSGNDLSFLHLQNKSDFRAEGSVSLGKDSSSEQTRNSSFLKEERFWSPFPSNDFISER